MPLKWHFQGAHKSVSAFTHPLGGGVRRDRVAAARRRRIPVRPGYAKTHKKPAIQRRLDRSVVFLDLYRAVDPFDPFSLAGDGYRLVGRFLGVRSSMQPHYAIGICIDVYIP